VSVAIDAAAIGAAMIGDNRRPDTPRLLWRCMPHCGNNGNDGAARHGSARHGPRRHGDLRVTLAGTPHTVKSDDADAFHREHANRLVRFRKNEIVPTDNLLAKLRLLPNFLDESPSGLRLDSRRSHPRPTFAPERSSDYDPHELSDAAAGRGQCAKRYRVRYSASC